MVRQLLQLSVPITMVTYVTCIDPQMMAALLTRLVGCQGD